MKITRTFDLLERYKTNFVDKEDVFASKKNGKWVKYSTQQYIDNAYYFAAGLFAMNFKKGDKIATISDNRPEWNFIDLGMAMLGVVHVPIFPSLTKEDYKYVLEHSDAKIAVISHQKLVDIVKPAIDEVETIEDFYTFDKIDGINNWQEIIELGKKDFKNISKEIEKIKETIISDDFATLIYTSGTTGRPKGVMLSHGNMVSNFLAAAKIFELKPKDKFLSILPLCHVGGRMGSYQTQYSGCSIYYVENMGTIAPNMREIKPNGFDTVPRILEKVYDTIIAKGKKLTGIKKKIFFWAVELGLKYKPFGENGFFYEQKLKIADKLIFSKWREALGGNVRTAGCGGASLQPRLERIFWAAGIHIINMYGLTETSPIITINEPKKGEVKLGTTGALIDGVEVKIAEDGEILCKGHNVMLGYYKDKKQTEEVFDKDGWFKTGDIGEWVEGRFLKITDRKKEIFKLSNGKYIAPQIIENILKESVFIDQSIVIGDGEKFASAIISPNFSYIKDWCKKNNYECTKNEEIINKPEIQKIFSLEIKKFNQQLSQHERLLKYKLVPNIWSPASGELSPTLKLRRKFIMKKNNDILEQIYKKKSI